MQWTTLEPARYQRLFLPTAQASPNNHSGDDGGPAAVPEPEGEATLLPEDNVAVLDSHRQTPLSFVFRPDLGKLINPTKESLAEGTDTHAVMHGRISVNPLKAAFEAGKVPQGIETEAGVWKL